MSSTASVLRRLCLVLVFCLLVVHLSAAVLTPNITFTLSSQRAPWPAGGGAYAVAVLTNMPQFAQPASIPYRAGGFSSYNDSTGADTGANNQQWVGDDPQGQSWTSLGNATWTPRAFGSIIYVPLSIPLNATATVNGILLIAGGLLANGSGTNQVWSSVDTVVIGKTGVTRTLGKNWVLNGGNGCNVSACVDVEFSPRALAGLVVATAFDNKTTVYAYLMGGVNDELTLDELFNDMYFSRGKGITPWVRLNYSAPWSNRYGFGIQPYTFTAGSHTGVIIVGGFSDRATMNDVSQTRIATSPLTRKLTSMLTARRVLCAC